MTEPVVLWLLMLWICHPDASSCGYDCGYDSVGYYATKERCLQEIGQTSDDADCIPVCCEPVEAGEGPKRPH